jgi:chitinase
LRDRAPLAALTLAFGVVTLAAGSGGAAIGRADAEARGPAREVVAYWGGWSVSEDEPVFPRDLPVDRLTTLVWFAVRYDPSTRGCGLVTESERYNAVERRFAAVESVDGSADPRAGAVLRGSWRQLALLRAQHPNLRILASIVSPWGSGELAPAARSPAARRRFARSCVDLLVRGIVPGVAEPLPGLFDGIDVDWEYPDGPRQRRQLTLLVAELRRELDAAGPGHLLTIAAQASPHAPEKYELEAIHPYLDWINLMTYDQHGSWDTRTNFHAPLRRSPGLPDHGLTLERTVELYLAAGVPPEKLVLGVPFYGRGWRGVRSKGDGLYAPARCGKRHATCPARNPERPQLFGAADYRVLEPLYAAGPLYRDETAQQVWTFDPERRVFWTSDDPQTIRAKMAFVREQGLRGAMIWEITQDTDDGALLDAVVSGLG